MLIGCKCTHFARVYRIYLINLAGSGAGKICWKNGTGVDSFRQSIPYIEVYFFRPVPKPPAGAWIIRTMPPTILCGRIAREQCLPIFYMGLLLANNSSIYFIWTCCSRTIPPYTLYGRIAREILLPIFYADVLHVCKPFNTFRRRRAAFHAASCHINVSAGFFHAGKIR